MRIQTRRATEDFIPANLAKAEELIQQDLSKRGLEAEFWPFGENEHLVMIRQKVAVAEGYLDDPVSPINLFVKDFDTLLTKSKIPHKVWRDSKNRIHLFTEEGAAVEGVTRSASLEMSMQAPTQEDYDMMQTLFPNASDLSTYPSPAELRQRFSSYSLQQQSACSDSFGFINGKGVASYTAVYNHAIVPLRELLSFSSLGDRLDYLVSNPIRYKKDKNKKMDECRDDARACLAGDTSKKAALKTYIALSFSNLSEWFYLSSNTAYHYLRDFLIEKFRYLRREINTDAFIPKTKTYVHMKELPQRSTTSRSRGENETELYNINAGYRIIDDIDQETGEIIGRAVQLVVWFYHDAKTQRSIFTDYFDVEDNNIGDALNKMRQSDLYRGWVRKFTPKQYENACAIFRVNADMEEDELKGLTEISQDPTENA